uniref:NADH-ubiquinone oxidoreductase chain 5 n=1 Tax=Neoamphitrite affinis TaxID=2716569 RepID=A0A8F9WI58_9ANNE|nr:NADH dehydrogenase subunit 5 [Neoamphitrite affinis]
MIKQFKLYTIFFIALFFMSLLSALTSLFFILYDYTLIIQWEIFSMHNSFFYFPIILDPKGLLFSSIVLFISANVMMFAQTYMMDNIFTSRFVILVLMFISSMNMLIFFPHLMTLLLGWDGLGLTSFLLVIYYQNSKSLGAGMLTALTNRVGDAMLLLAIGWTINSNNWSIINMWNNSLSYLIATTILIAALTKSAQMPFSSWLPAAMAAPTPVSALVHSSTLVTAGVFLLIRFYNFIAKFAYLNYILLFIACVTMMMAGLSALTECDLKKIIALSTLSQLGVMMASLGLSAPNLAFFHLLTHALFKALLFICAGSIIHFSYHGQDLRMIGSLTPQLPFTMSALLIANMSLCGLPFLSGFYSKDLILELSLFTPINWMILLMLFFATMLTMAYSFRLMFSAIWSPSSSYPLHNINNNDYNIILPTFLLTTGAIIAGAMISWQMFPMTNEIFLPMHMKMTPFFITLLGGYLTYIFSEPFSTTNSKLILMELNHTASASMWFMTLLSTQTITPLPLNIAHNLQKTLDQGWMETTSAQGSYLSATFMSKNLIYLQNNNIMTMLHLSSLLFIILFLSLLLFF